MADNRKLCVATYNMHGYNQGNLYASDLCKLVNVLFVQEHWLLPWDLHKLHNICNDFVCYSSSAMSSVTDTSILVGRPFGGVAILVDKATASYCKLICKADRYIIIKYFDVLFINVYMPCKSSANYQDVFNETLASIINIVNDTVFKFIVCGGDFNIDLSVSSSQFGILSNFLQELNLVAADALLPAPDLKSYRHATQNASSLIDHFFISTDLYSNISDVSILDDGDNLSDHLPVVMNMSVQCHFIKATVSESNTLNVSRLRWDKCDLSNYYNLTHYYLSAVNVPMSLLYSDGSVCTQNDGNVPESISLFYNELVGALNLAATQSVPVCKQNFFKFWWDEECQLLKDNSVSKHRVWVDSGRPHVGPIACDMRKSRAEYKLHIKHKRYAEHTQFTNDLHDALIDKSLPSFWRTWNARFGRKKLSSQVVDGVTDHGNIAEVFRCNFESASKPNSSSMHEKLQQEFYSAYKSYDGARFSIDEVANVELIDRMIRSLKRARAAGSDGITAEHLLHSHPLLTVLLSFLFRMMLLHNFVPDAFCLGMIVPLVKGDDLDTTNADNYRAITISPCISKVFEMCLAHGMESWLKSDELQFGFKTGRGCREAIYTLHGVVKHLNENGSTAVLCALDVSKAFDKVNHFGLYIKLMDRGIPKLFLDILSCWYSKCFAFVKWGCFVSKQFPILAGVRQGGVLSPSLFAVYIDSIISKLKESGYGAHIGGYYVGCLVYADDIMLISHSICAMQQMLDVCSDEAVFLDLQFNTKKSVALRIGPRWQNECSPLILSNANLIYVNETRYLGVIIAAGKSFKCSFDHVKLKFYRCFNAIYNRAKNANSELVCVQLLKSFCLPVILYATEAVLPSKTVMRTFDSLINRAVYKMFGCSATEDINYIRSIVDLPCIEYIVHKRKAKFVKSFSLSSISFADYIVKVCMHCV